MVSGRRSRVALATALVAAMLVISPAALSAQGAARPAPVAPATPAVIVVGLIPGPQGLDFALWISWLAARWLGGGSPAPLLGTAAAADTVGVLPPPPPPGGGTGVSGSNGVVADPNG